MSSLFSTPGGLRPLRPHSSEHIGYLAQIGIAERPLTSSIAPKQRRMLPTGRPKTTIGVSPRRISTDFAA